MAKTLTKTLRGIYTISAYVFFFIFPLFFFTGTPNFFDTNKLALAVAFLALLLVYWGAHTITNQTFSFTLTPFTLPAFAVAVAVLISAIFATPDAINQLVGLGSLIPALALISIIIVTLVSSRKFLRYALYTLIASGTVLAIISIFQSLGFGLSRIVNSILGTSIPDTLAFTPAGSPLALIAFLAPILLITLILAFSHRESLEKVVLFLVSALITSGAVLVLIYSFPGKDTAPVFLPVKDGYAIALETLKDPKRALVGYGPESFVSAYNQLRPATLNLTKFWNTRFTNSSNELFDIVTTTGVIGLAAWLYLTSAMIKTARSGSRSLESKVISIAALASLFLFILIPATYLHFFIFFTLLTLWGVSLKLEDRLSHHLEAPLNGISLVRPGAQGVQESPLAVLPYLTAAPLVILAGVIGYYGYRAYAAELSFKTALDAAAKNQGVPTYDAQRAAITANPYIPRYRRAYSVTNLALANSLAGKDQVTDKDKQDITQLIQQSIREAKVAVTLEPSNAANWENLTFVYRSLIGIAQNADQWTIAALAQAIKNDPVNPNLRLELGGIFYSQGQYDQAIRFYQQASELKPDWANAYYNLSAAYKQKKDLNSAYNYLRQVIALVQPNSADYTKAQTELQDLASQLNLKKTEQPTPQPAQSDLTVPSPAPTPAQNQVNLPQNAGPQELAPTNAPETIPTPAKVNPTVTPAPSPTTQP